jgi:NTE family protein
VALATLAVLVWSLGLGSAHYPINPPLENVSFPDGYYLESSFHQGADEILLALTFSGGGARAAALAYGVLEALRDTPVRIDGRERRLLDEVDAISAVSGGSFTAAYYGLFGERLFQDFESRFLTRNVERDLRRRFLSWSGFQVLVSPRYDRSDLVADYFNEALFEGRTFRDIMVRPGPSVFINATDVTLGSQFTFDQRQFDLLCSDLLPIPVARAVVASSAVPILFSSIVLRNYAGGCGYRPPEWIVGALYERDTGSPRFHRAKQEIAYLNRVARPFIHLYDGGLADNLGVRALIDRVLTTGGIWKALGVAELQNLRRLAVIVVNAQADPDDSPSRFEESLSLGYTVISTTSVPLNQYNHETLALLEDLLETWEGDIKSARCDLGRPDLRIDRVRCDEIETYLVHINFDALRDGSERQYLQDLPASLDLEPEAVARLKAAAARLLRESIPFQRLLTDLSEADSAPADEGKTRTGR